MDLKHVVIVDDDIDVDNPMDVEWAIATRVQADRDVIVIPGARAKPLDPSLAVTPPGVVPVGAKVGIDATIAEGVPHERFERIAYAYADRAKIDDYLAGKSDGAHANTTSDERTVGRVSQRDPRARREDAALLLGHRREARRRRVSGGRAGDRQAARGREAVAGRPRPPVPAQFGPRGEAACRRVMQKPAPRGECGANAGRGVPAA